MSAMLTVYWNGMRAVNLKQKPNTSSKDKIFKNEKTEIRNVNKNYLQNGRKLEYRNELLVKWISTF